MQKLREISSQLKKASAMHKAQAGKIDRLIKSMKKKEMSKLSKKQRMIARAAMPFDKITKADFDALKKRKKKK